MARKSRRKSPTRSRASHEAGAGATERHPLPFTVVGIGGSAGGVEAFTQMLRALRPDTGMAFVFILHMGQHQKSMLTEIASRATRMPVVEVTRETAPRPNTIHVISPGTLLELREGKLVPGKGAQQKGPLRSIDHFFRSLAAAQGNKSIGVVLSGSAHDGTLGCEEIKAEGGITFAQDATAGHDSMPHSAIAANCVDFVLPPDEIAKEIVRIAGHPLVSSEVEPTDILPSLDLAAVLEILHNATGVDFAHYKRNTLYRRISRRMVLQRVGSLEEYVSHLRRAPDEVESLYQDVLIGVTSFFRDEAAYDSLKQDVFPRLVADRPRSDNVRMWALGCSTGEEAYSLAIAFSEFVEDTGRPHALQMFATDLNGRGIDKARAGDYPASIASDVSPERLRRYFTETDGGYRVRKAIRDVCIFARHNILTEPPFSRIDLISCRNLLIYLGQEMQQRIIPILHYSLRPDGYLWLGKSETIGMYRDLFELEDPRNKIYRKKATVPRLVLPGAVTGFRPPAAARQEGKGERPRELPLANLIDSQKEAERILLSRYAPASVLVNADFDILQFRGNTGAYLTPAPGRASLNLLKMLREGLTVSVRNLLNTARRNATPVRKDDLRVRANGGYRAMSAEVIPIKGGGAAPSSYLVLFEEPVSRERTARLKRERVWDAEQDARTEQSGELKKELAATREYLQSVIEQQEAANEELQSANEEIQSANEELQSINEELETSKEEVQSSNEELATVNDELNHRNAELSRTNNDLVNLLSSVQMAIVMLDSCLRIRRLTPAAEKMLNLIPADVGRPIRDLKLNISIDDLEQHLEDVIDSVSVKEFEVMDKQGKWNLLRLRPYRTTDNKIDGVVLVLVDIDAIKRDQQQLRRQAELLEQAHEPILVWEIGGPILYWNRAAEEIYGYSKTEALSRRNHELLGTVQAAPGVEESLEKYGRWTGKVVHTARDGRKVTMDSRMSLVREGNGRKLVIETNRPLDGE